MNESPTRTTNEPTMSKPAETRYDVHDLIRDRWSPLAFADRPVSGEELGRLLEAARWAASSYNEQPWGYVIATRDDAEAFETMHGCLAEGNQPWTAKAPVLMLACAKQQFERNGKPNRHAAHDVGLANGNLVLQAMAHGLYVHMMAGFEPQKARVVLGIPEGWDPLTMMAVGYLGSAADLPESLRERENAPRSRRPMSDFVFAGKWGNTAGFAE